MFNSIKDKIKEKRLIIFGEVHGTKEIPNLIEKFLTDISKEEDFNLCLEIPKEFQGKIDKFIKEGDEDKLREIPFFLEPENQDGRGSLEYLNLIKKIYTLNKNYNTRIKIFCIDPTAINQEEKEKGLADNIIKIINFKKTFVILGDVHASKNSVSFHGKKFLPAGAILLKELGDKMFSVRILPMKGKFFNFGVKEISEDYSDYSFNKNFDYIFKIEEITPCSFLES